MIYVINLCQSDLVLIMDVNASVGKNWEIRDEGNKGQAKKAKTKQCFVGGFCFRCTFPFRKTTSVFYIQYIYIFIFNNNIINDQYHQQYYSGKPRIHIKTPVGNYIAKSDKNNWIIIN